MIKFGLLVNWLQSFGPAGQRFDYSREGELLARVCMEADRLGFYSITMIDHLEHDVFEPLTALSYVAGLTKNIRISQAVLNPTLRSPALIAKMTATLDRLSNGRLELGIGSGTLRSESYAPYGIPVQHQSGRVERLIEFIHVVKSLWKGTSFDFEGKYYHLKGALIEPTPRQTPRPRIMIGGRSQKLMEIATEHEAWNYFFHPIHDPPSPSKCREKIEEFDKICEEKGVSPETVDKCIEPITLMATEDRQKVNGFIEKAANIARVNADEIRKRFEFAFVGTPEDVEKRVEAFVGAGVNYFLLSGPGLRDPDSLEIFARDIMEKYK